MTLWKVGVLKFQNHLLFLNPVTETPFQFKVKKWFGKFWESFSSSAGAWMKSRPRDFVQAPPGLCPAQGGAVRVSTWTKSRRCKSKIHFLFWSGRGPGQRVPFSEREGFEPSVRIELVQRISNQPLSTTQPSLLFNWFPINSSTPFFFSIQVKLLSPAFLSFIYFFSIADIREAGVSALRCKWMGGERRTSTLSNVLRRDFVLRLDKVPAVRCVHVRFYFYCGVVRRRRMKCRVEKITLALSWCFLLDFQQVCQLLQSFTAKFGMDWRGSTEAKSTRVSAEQSSGEGFVLLYCAAPPGWNTGGQADTNTKELSLLRSSTIFCGEKRGQNQFAFSISQLKPLLAFHLIPIKTACLAAAL